jgi:DNA replication protein DnaC
VSRFIAPANEQVCSLCGGTGWRRAEGEEFIGFRQCQCVKARVQAARLSAIPELFKTSTFDSYHPRNQHQECALALMHGNPGGSWYLTGLYGNGKTHLLYAQYRALVLSGKIRCHVRTTRELVEELRRAELNDSHDSPVIASASNSTPYHIFWDDIDKLKLTDFKTEVLFNLVDSLYSQKHGLTVTGNYSMRELIEHERMHPAIVRRLNDMCRVVEV